MTAWYNEPDPFAAQWLRNLITAGLIAPGIVDERKIQDVEAWELHEFTQCHFFAGIGVWSYALRQAGWSDDRPIWTGSCPCQPFSAAGKQKGFSDERHLWPVWYPLIQQCRPSVVIGEQVASKDGLGWLDLVSADMESASYAFGAGDLCAAGFGGAHIRQRLYFVGMADTNDQGPQGFGQRRNSTNQRIVGQDGMAGGVDNPTGARHFGQIGKSENDSRNEARLRVSGDRCKDGGVADSLPAGWSERRTVAGIGQIAGSSATIRMADSDGSNASTERQQSSGQHGFKPRDSSGGARTFRNSWEAGSLDDADWLLCRNPAGEPSWRPVEPFTFPLAHGITGRVGCLRAYGNALDAKTAQGFCEVVKEIADEIRPVTKLEFDL